MQIHEESRKREEREDPEIQRGDDRVKRAEVEPQPKPSMEREDT
jgi:hypothetical protein